MHVSGQKISGTDIQHIIELGKSLLKMPIELLPGVKETLKVLKEKGKYKLVVATKGDLLDQENKLGRSGLASYFDHSDGTSRYKYRLDGISFTFKITANGFNNILLPSFKYRLTLSE